MCDHRTLCNPHWHIRSRQNTIKRVHRVAPDLIQHTQYCHGSTMSNVKLKQTPVRKLAPLTTRSSSLRCVSATEHYNAEQYSKMDRTKPRKHLPRSDLSWNTRLDFLKTKSLWEAALETERWCFSKLILESNVTPNITRSSDLQYSSANNYWGWLVMHCAWPGNYHSLGLTCIQLYSPKVTPLTNPAMVTDQGLCYCNSIAWGWHNSHQSRVISITDQLLFQNGKKLRSVQEEQ